MTDPFDPAIANVIESSSIPQAFWRRVSEFPDPEFLKYGVASSATATRVWKTESYRTLAPKVSRVARKLQHLGVGVGTPVAILSHTRLEWIIADLAIQSLGAITISIYHSLPANEVGYILFDSGARIIFVENEEQAAKIQVLSTSICIVPERESQPSFETQLSFDHVLAFEPIESMPGATLNTVTNDESLDASPMPVPAELTRESIASIVYTSGTTGPPKGVVQTHGNHLSNVHQAYVSGVFPPDGSLFLYLPLAHSFARLAYYIGALTTTGVVLPAIIDHRSSKVDLSSVAKDLREGGATVAPSVPRLFEKMSAALMARAAGRGIQPRILRICLANARSVYDAKAAKRPLGILQQIIYEGMAPVRLKVKQQLFGAHFDHGISGGAKLDPEVNRFFDSLGILILEGYGLTETCVATHVNLPKKRKIGTVGPPFLGLEVRIDGPEGEDGEIWMRGPNVTRRYWNRPQASAEAYTEDGWFKSGDIGRVDSEGFLSITDRKKELIVTAGGKKIAPQGVESLFKSIPFISQSFLYGDGKPYCVVLFTLNDAELRQILSARGIRLSDGIPAHADPKIRELLQNEVDKANLKLASYESIKKFAVLPEDFTIENGQLTPTLKVRRKEVVKRHAGVIEALYAGPSTKE